MSAILNLMLSGIVVCNKQDFDRAMAKLKAHKEEGNLTEEQYQYLKTGVKEIYNREIKRRRTI